MWILFAIFVVALVVAVISVVLLLLVRNARAAQGPATLAQYPQGHWLSVGMCIGIAIGLIPSLTGIFGSLGIAVANACSLPDVGLGNASATTGGACEAERCRLSRQFPKSRIFSDDMAAWTAIGPSMGIGIGVAIGAALEQKHKHETRPLTEKERQIQKWAMLIGLLLAALGILVLVDVLVLTSLR